MKRQALESLRTAIEENTERRSLEDLKKQGKRHVRVVSGDRVMAIIKAVVADIVDKEVGEISERDRMRIEQETKREFDRVLRMQSEQEDLLSQQRAIAEEYRGKAERLAVSVDEADRRIEELRQELAERTLDAERLRAERDGLARDLESDRRSPEVAALHDQLGQMRELLTALQERTDRREEELLRRIEEKSGADASALDDRFRGTLDAALDKITRTMEAATAKPVDVGAIEATNVLVDKLFDMEEASAETNLGRLEVEERSSRSSIAHNLDRLKAMRAGTQAAPVRDEQEERNERDDEADGGGKAPSKARAIDASVERLKAMREGRDKEEPGE